jgi:hypothetical protein
MPWYDHRSAGSMLVALGRGRRDPSVELKLLELELISYTSLIVLGMRTCITGPARVYLLAVDSTAGPACMSKGNGR